jgi:hypothetical protein
MSSSIRDASLTTARRRQLALYAWRNSDQYSYNPQTLKREQTVGSGNQSGPSGEVATQAFVGAQLAGQAGDLGPCGCSSNVTLRGYAKNEPGR